MAVAYLYPLKEVLPLLSVQPPHWPPCGFSNMPRPFFYLKAFTLPVILFSFGWLTLILHVSLNITSSSPCKTGHPSPTFYYRILFMSSTALFIIKLIIFIFIIVILLVSCLPGPLWTTTSSSFLISLFISESLVCSTMLGI